MTAPSRGREAATPPGSPTVSVVIPAYNVEEWIGESLDSVLAQTFEDYEVVVVDDGSRDGTVELVEGYVSRHPGRIRLVRQEQGGASRARNRGIDEARGEFIAFLDADDLWLPRKLELQVAAFRADPDLGLVTCLHESFSPTKVNRGGLRKGEYLFGGDNLPRAIVMYSGMATPTVMVPRWVLDEVGVFDETLAIAEDDNLWIRITARHPAHLVDELLVRCRFRPGSLSSDLETLFDDVFANLDRLMASDPEIRRQIEDGVPFRKSHVAWNRGYHAFDRGEYGRARRSFVEAIRHNWRNTAAWKFLPVTLLPSGLVQRLRRARRRVKGDG